MKSTELIYRLFFVFFLTSIAFTLNGCSGSDDETNINNSCQTFLECQDETVWKDVPEYIGDFLKFQNNQNDPWVTYYTYDEECYYFYNLIDQANITIIENSKNILKYRTGYDGGENRGIHTFTYSNGKINFKDEFYTNDVLIDVSIFILKKSDINLSSLTICN